MSQSNNITIEGNLTADPELRFTNNGTAVCNVRVAQSDSFMRNGERHETTEYFTVVVWNGQAENVAMSLSKGQRVVVNGKLRQRTVEIDGTTRYFTELHADVVAVSLRWALVEDIIKSTATKPGKALVPAGDGPVDADHADDPEDPF